jgi:DNA mismatch repair protein MutS2
MAREEALEALDRHVDRAVMSGLSRVSIVHGKGMGILKSAVEDALRADSRVESFREGVPEEGGWGVTIVKLKA